MPEIYLRRVAFVGVIVLLGLALPGTAISYLFRSQLPGVITTVSLDPQPVLVAVDERLGHAFIISWNFGNNPADTGIPDYLGVMTTLDTRSGAVMRTAAVGIDSSDIAVDERTSRVFVTNADDSDKPNKPRARGSVSVLDAHTGRLVRSVVVGRYPAALAVDEHTGRVFVTNEGDATVTLLDARTGRFVQTVKVGSSPATVAVDARTGRVFVGHDASVNVLDAQSGALLHTVAINKAIGEGSGFVVNDRTNRVFIVNNETLNVLDAHSGAHLRSVGLGTPGDYALIDVHTNRIFIMSQKTNVAIMLDATTGTMLRAIPLGTRIGRGVVDQRRHRLFVAASDETGRSVIAILDTQSGQILAHIALRGDAGAVDERAGRVFVLDALGSTVSLLDANADHITSTDTKSA